MDAAAPFAIVANDLRERFIKLLDSLSTVPPGTSSTDSSTQSSRELRP